MGNSQPATHHVVLPPAAHLRPHHHRARPHRPQHQQVQQKLVVPDRGAHQRLRPTGNGEILHAGGTISGRRQERLTACRSASSTLVRPHQQQGAPPPPRTRMPPRPTQTHRKDQMKRFGSEPDLRLPTTQCADYHQASRGRKKYKAPPPPPPLHSLPPIERHAYEEEHGLEAGSPIRRARLFKTRAETKKKPSSNDHSSMQRTRSSPEFHAELTQLVTQRRHILQEAPPPPPAPVPKVKSFYFGMEEAHVSSDSDAETLFAPDIALRLRPILPKKQLDVPRFSPTAAWKLLAVDAASTLQQPVAAPSEGGSLGDVEERIEKLERPPPSTTHDRSGDSGISGDDETPDRPRGMSWTPQQDLDDDDDDDDDDDSSLLAEVARSTTVARPHIFSLSLPRDNHLAAYKTTAAATSWQPYTTSLQKLKRSMSGVLASLSRPDASSGVEEDPQEAGENWFLSRSAPNSLSNGFSSLRRDETQPRRIMYLPQQPSASSKSYENIATLPAAPPPTPPQPQNLQDPPDEVELRRWAAVRKPATRKFTFQSTVRQIERKRLADRLSKEAERKEMQRRRELEAMQRVEEEFQRKRAREKANIRQQLRMYSLDEAAAAAAAAAGCCSLPPSLEVVPMALQARPEPDGAVSSSSTSSPTLRKERDRASSTRILSEFRQSHREYKEFRSAGRYLGEHAAVVHPRVTCNMPKATG